MVRPWISVPRAGHRLDRGGLDNLLLRRQVSIRTLIEA